jgi:hypothetical protein
MHRDKRRASTSKRSRETEAEAVAFVVCQGIGLETGSAAQDYIQLYEGDAKLLSESLEYIQQTATLNLNAIGAVGSSAPPAWSRVASVSGRRECAPSFPSAGGDCAKLIQRQLAKHKCVYFSLLYILTEVNIGTSMIEVLDLWHASFSSACC